MVGKTISHYKILEKLGEGGMGVVYKAQDTKLDRLVALKFLPPHLAADEQDKKRFIHEAKAASSLDHPNICNVHEIDETPDGQVFLVMAIYEGTLLNRKIEKGPLKIDEAVDVAIQAAEGLQAAHEKGIVHRDVKSSNIMITDKGRAVIMDFGLARTGGATKLTKTGSTLGTVPYMSSEQARGEKVDHRTDIWSLGIVLYEMITGRLPFRSDYNEALVYSILNEDPPPPTSLRSDVPMELERIVKKAMQKDRTNRYQHADEMLTDLRTLKRELESGLGKELPQKPRPRRKHIALYAGVTALAVILVVGGLLLFRGEKTPTSISAIAVLPLKNLTGDPEQDYFVEGMHEALTAELSKISALKVISRTSTMRYKDTDKAMPQIARELDVAGLIEGSVLREGDQVRITVQLIHGPSDRHLWAQSFDRELRGVLALHSDVARAIAREIKIAVTPAEARQLASARAVNPEAYEAYLKGRLHVEKMSPDALDTALEYFQLALENDPNYARAYVGIGFVWATRAHTELLPPREGFAKARAAAVKAVKLDDTLAEAHELLAVVLVWHDWDWVAGEREFRRAIELNPNYASVRSFYSLFLRLMRRPHEARTQIERALELDPYNPFFHFILGGQLVDERRYDEAITQYRKAATMQPDGLWPHRGLWEVFHEKRMHKEALAEAKQYFALKHNREIVEALERGYAEGGYARAMKLAAETLARSQRTYVNPNHTAILYAYAGEQERTMEWLEEAYRTRSSELAYINVEPTWNPVRGDPRFQALLRRMNFPNAVRTTR
ncbi:MAG: protein kinase [Ignavibacteriales bacterium]|nr:protein kinase [Ignavibacteriales bacterium]